MSVCVLSKFNGTSIPKGSYRAKAGDNDSNVNSSHYGLSTALCESIRYQAKSEQNWQHSNNVKYLFQFPTNLLALKILDIDVLEEPDECIRIKIINVKNISPR